MPGVTVSRGKTRRLPHSGRHVPLLQRLCKRQSVAYHVKRRALQHESTQVFIKNSDDVDDSPKFFPLIENPNVQEAQPQVHLDFNGGYGVASLHKATRYMDEDMFTKTFAMCIKTGEGTSWDDAAIQLGFQHKVEHVFVHALNEAAEESEEFKPIVYAQCTSDVMSDHLRAYANGRIRAVARLQASGALPSSSDQYEVCSEGSDPAQLDGTVIFMEGACVAVRGCHSIHSSSQYGKDYAQLFASHVPEELLQKQQLKVPTGTKYMQQVNRGLDREEDFKLEPDEEAAVQSFLELIEFWKQEGKPVSVICLENITTHGLLGISVGMLAALHRVAKKHHIAVLHDNTSNALYCGKLFAHNLFKDERVRPDLVVGCKALDLYFLSLVNPYDDEILRTPYFVNGEVSCSLYGDLLGSFHGLVTTPVYAFNLLKATAILAFIKQHGVLEKVKEFGEVIGGLLNSFATQKLTGAARNRFFFRGVGVIFSTNLDYSREMLAGNVVGDRFRCYLNVDVSSVRRWARAAFLPRLRGAQDADSEEISANAAIASRKRVNSDRWRRHEGRNVYRKVVLGVAPVPVPENPPLRIRLRLGADASGGQDTGSASGVDAREEAPDSADAAGVQGDADAGFDMMDKENVVPGLQDTGTDADMMDKENVVPDAQDSADGSSVENEEIDAADADADDDDFLDNVLRGLSLMSPGRTPPLFMPVIPTSAGAAQAFAADDMPALTPLAELAMSPIDISPEIAAAALLVNL